MTGPGNVRRVDARRSDAAAKPVSSDMGDTAPPTVTLANVSSVCVVVMAVIAVLAVLYLGRIFFLPIVTGFVIGTMLSPAANVLAKHGVPRSVSAILIVIGVFAVVAFIGGLISAPLLDWSERLPEITATLKAKAHVFDRPLEMWRQLKLMIGDPASVSPAFELPKIDWANQALDFLSPTLAEILVFFATLVLFIASWPEMRRATILMTGDREARLRTLRILNAIERQLGGYLLMVTGINVGVGIVTGLICAVTGMPNPAGLGALAATLNYIPIIGPIVMFATIAVVGLISFPTISGALLPCLLFAGMTFVEGHFVTPSIIGRRLALNALAVFLALTFWTWLWGPMGAFLSSPILIVGLILNEHLTDSDTTQLPEI